eukprot:Amastigsp_a850259_20.p4 type:complete len:149 gc:universal Amastigsp_a850259_20:571-125(-)
MGGACARRVLVAACRAEPLPTDGHDPATSPGPKLAAACARAWAPIFGPAPVPVRAGHVWSRDLLPLPAADCSDDSAAQDCGQRRAVVLHCAHVVRSRGPCMCRRAADSRGRDPSSSCVRCEPRDSGRRGAALHRASPGPQSCSFGVLR